MDSASDRSNSPYDIDFLLNPLSTSEIVQDSPTRKPTENSPTHAEHWRHPAGVAGARDVHFPFPYRSSNSVSPWSFDVLRYWRISLNGPAECSHAAFTCRRKFE